MRALHRRALFGIGLLGCVAVACQLVAGIDRVEKVPAPPSDGGAAGNEAGFPDPCAHVVPPPPPADDDDQATRLAPFYLAMRTLSFDPKNGGVDLDGVCTCDTRPHTAHDGGASCHSTSDHCDLDGGVDTEVGLVFGAAAQGAVNLGGVTGVIQSGSRNLLLQVRNWNGKRNDKDVTFGIVTSSGINDPSGCGEPDISDAGIKHPPLWCGRDKWDVLPNTATTVEGVLSPSLRGAAWVNNGTLVYETETSVSFFLGDGTVTFGSPIITGKLETLDDGRRRLTGILTGRIAIGEMLTAIGQFSTVQDDVSIQVCQSNSFPLIRATLCAAQDIAHSKTLDFAENTDCDAISASVNFIAEEAAIGNEDHNPPQPAACDPSRVADPSIYACPK